MANLSRFRTDVPAVQNGEWVKIDLGDGDPFEIKTRGFHKRYRDVLSALQREAARRANRGLLPGQIPFTPDALPPSVDDDCQIRALIDLCLLDVRGLTHDAEGKEPVTIDQFREMILDREQYGALAMMALSAARSVGALGHEETEAAAKNSAPASDGA